MIYMSGGTHRSTHLPFSVLAARPEAPVELRPTALSALIFGMRLLDAFIVRCALVIDSVIALGSLTNSAGIGEAINRSLVPPVLCCASTRY